MNLRHNFPNYFLWGTSTTASQIAGTWHYVGNGESFRFDIANTPETIRPKHNGYLANDHYHLDRTSKYRSMAMYV
ncbi:family 1 glycosylhydrolase [Herpetosiphon gulosus]|uniref:family 1 glycosylhydrolase n=1 Tax=Herpetosiphon gulosus TaxID=1973496 RepID=UPI0031EBBC64